MKNVTVIIPALNEADSIGAVIDEIPTKKLKELGYGVRILVVDNGSTDRTAAIARQHKATVITQPIKGYGYAYSAGFNAANGDIIITGDADMTYPFESIPDLLQLFERSDYDFLNTNRLSAINTGIMNLTNIIGNKLLTTVMRLLFFAPFKDSQSGMWVFKRSILEEIDIQSMGMPFSQEIKIEAYMRGFSCGETDITYKKRQGSSKLHIIRDGMGNLNSMVSKRISYGLSGPKNTENLLQSNPELSTEELNQDG